MAVAVARTRQGRTIHVDPADGRARRLIEADGDLNPQSQRLWRTALTMHPWERVLDVGANYGEMLVNAALPAGAEVTAFEPNPSVLPYLRKTVADNGLDVEVRAEAVSAQAGEAEFRMDRVWSGMSSLDPGGEADPARYDLLEVPVVTLDDVLGESTRSTCIKVDVEGFESAVVTGAARALTRIESWAVMMEVLHMPRSDLADWAARYPTHFLDRRTGALVRLPGGQIDLTATWLGSGWLYPQDCLMLSPAVVDSLAVSR